MKIEQFISATDLLKQITELNPQLFVFGYDCADKLKQHMQKSMLEEDNHVHYSLDFNFNGLPFEIRFIVYDRVITDSASFKDLLNRGSEAFNLTLSYAFDNEGYNYEYVDNVLTIVPDSFLHYVSSFSLLL